MNFASFELIFSQMGKCTAEVKSKNLNFFLIDDYAEDGGEELLTKMDCV